jgi:hypothetical protein
VRGAVRPRKIGKMLPIVWVRPVASPSAKLFRRFNIVALGTDPVRARDTRCCTVAAQGTR